MAAVLDWVQNVLSGESPWGFFFVFIGGIITAFSPCCLSTLSLILGFLGIRQEQTLTNRQVFGLVAWFSIGLTVALVLLGILVAWIGTLFQLAYLGGWWFVLLGVFMLILAMQTWGVITLIPSTTFHTNVTRKDKLGAFLIGILGGFFSTPCSTPVLLAILTIASQSGQYLYGMGLLLAYSLGHSVLIFIGAFSIGRLQRWLKETKTSRIRQFSTFLLGFSIFLLGLYLIYQGI